MDPKETERFNKILINGYEELLKSKPENPQAHFIHYLLSSLPDEDKKNDPQLYAFYKQYQENLDDQSSKPFDQISYNDRAESPEFNKPSGSTSKSRPPQSQHETANSKIHQKPVNNNYEDSLNDSKGNSDKRSSSTAVVINIKLGENLTKEICCDLDDNVLELAQDFCKENSLSEQAVPVIIKMIKQQFTIVLDRMRNNKKNKVPEDSVSFDERKTTFGPRQPGNERALTEQDEPRRPQVYENPASNRNKNNSKPKLMGKLDVAIAPSQTRELRIFQGEDPAQVARQFCDENNLPAELVKVLQERLVQIQKHYETNRLKKLRKEEEAQSAQTPAFNRITFGEKNSHDDNENIGNSERSTQNPYNDVQREYKTEPVTKTPKQTFNPFTIGSNSSRNASPSGSPNFSKQNTVITPVQSSPINNKSTSVQNTSGNNRSTPVVMKSLPDEKPKSNLDSKPIIERNEEPEQDKDDPANAYEKWTKLIKEKQGLKRDDAKKGDFKGNKGNLSRRDQSQDSARSRGMYQEAVNMMKSKSPMRKNDQPRPEFKVQKLPNNLSHMNSNLRMTRDEEKDLLKRVYYNDLMGKGDGEGSQSSRKQNDNSREMTFNSRSGHRSPEKVIIDKSKSPMREPERPAHYPSHLHRVMKAKEDNHKLMQEKYSFRPKISNTSYELAKKREQERARSKSPVNNDQNRSGTPTNKADEKWKRNKYDNSQPYSPKLPKDIGKFLQKRPQMNQKDFTNRLVDEAVERNEKKLQAQMVEKTRIVDPKTGQRLYSPVVNHDKYYQKVKEKEEAASNKSQSRSRTPRLSEHSAVGSHMESQASERSKLQEVFDKLDSDQDGYISSHHIDISTLSPQVLEHLLTFMDFLEVNEARIDYNGFLLVLRGLEVEKTLLQSLEKEEKAGSNGSLNGQNLKLFRSQENVEEHKNFHNLGFNHTIEERDEESKYSRRRTPSKKSDFSTASSSHTENSARIPRHYQEILTKKLSAKLS